MSTTVALASLAAINSAQAADQAQQAHVAACTGTMRSFRADVATVAEMRVYSDCVRTVYPSPSGLTVGVVQVLFVLVILATVGSALGLISLKFSQERKPRPYYRYSLSGADIFVYSTGVFLASVILAGIVAFGIDLFSGGIS